jgi:short subunit dehydrogenase-like uncharacterized protein
MADSQHDIVLFGATGFTGGLTAEYLAAHADPGTRWALAGRSRAKLEAVRARLGDGNAELALIEADVSNPDSIRALAESTKVVITTVGPYINYGEPLVAACAAAGTDYVDLTGEPEFVDLMWLRYHERAQQTGARLVHSCGFDSIPYDLGVLYTVSQLPHGGPIAVDGFVRMGGTFSGGTFHSAVHAMGRLRESVKVGRERRQRESDPSGRRVLRSARALDRYGPDFSYSHYLVVKRLPVLAAGAVGAGSAVALAQLGPTRNLLLKIKDPGEGPSPEQRDRAWFRVRFRARAERSELRTQVSGGDPGYGETSKMLAQSALCLAHDQLPASAGQVTPAVAMGQALIDRLQREGIAFEVL